MTQAQTIIEWYEELLCEVDTIEEANEEFFERCDSMGIYANDGYQFQDGSKLLIKGRYFKAV